MWCGLFCAGWLARGCGWVCGAKAACGGAFAGGKHVKRLPRQPKTPAGGTWRVVGEGVGNNNGCHILHTFVVAPRDMSFSLKSRNKQNKSIVPTCTVMRVKKTRSAIRPCRRLYASLLDLLSSAQNREFSEVATATVLALLRGARSREGGRAVNADTPTFDRRYQVCACAHVTQPCTAKPISRADKTHRTARRIPSSTPRWSAIPGSRSRRWTRLHTPQGGR